MRNTVFHTQKQLGSAWHGAAFGFLSRTQASRAVLGEEPVSCGTTQSNQVKNWFYTVAPCRTNQKLFGTVRYGTARHLTARHGTARHGTARHGTVQRIKQPLNNWKTKLISMFCYYQLCDNVLVLLSCHSPSIFPVQEVLSNAYYLVHHLSYSGVKIF